MAMQTLYVLYNADGSVLGKLRYGYRKITCPKDAESECAACDITHGGLSLKETDAWVQAKKDIEASSDTSVVQWHRDELSPRVCIRCTDREPSDMRQVKAYINEHKVAYPAALLERDGQLQVVMDRAELGQIKGDAQLFVKQLRTKGVLGTSPNL
jgi:hypothetical protein